MWWRSHTALSNTHWTHTGLVLLWLQVSLLEERLELLNPKRNMCGCAPPCVQSVMPSTQSFQALEIQLQIKLTIKSIWNADTSMKIIRLWMGWRFKWFWHRRKRCDFHRNQSNQAIKLFGFVSKCKGKPSTHLFVWGDIRMYFCGVIIWPFLYATKF